MKGKVIMRALVPLAAAAALAAGCAHDPYDSGPYGSGPYGGYDYEGTQWAGRPHVGDLAGPGVEILDPWLAGTAEGQAIVAAGFRAAATGFVDEETAHRANVWFRRYADTDGDLCLTDPEIRVALVQASPGRLASRY